MTAVEATLRAAADGLLAVLFAARCAACSAPLDTPTAGPVCASCWASVLSMPGPLCRRCGDSLGVWRSTSAVVACCPRCRRGRLALDRAAAMGAYEGSLKAIVHAFKFDGLRSLATPLATLMCTRGGDVLAGADAVVPVPLHVFRRWRRGFNQAADLAVRLGPPMVRALRRRRATTPQSGLPASQRHRNVRGAFVLTAAARGLAGQTVVIVDDVCTTGATIEACARALKAAGCREVRALTAARAVRSRR
jgi:ComF family protein